MVTPASADDGGGDPPPNGVLVPPYQSSVITEKLGFVNYLFWKSQVLPVICGHYLHHFIANLQIPERFATLEDRDFGCVTPAY